MVRDGPRWTAMALDGLRDSRDGARWAGCARWTSCWHVFDRDGLGGSRWTWRRRPSPPLRPRLITLALPRCTVHHERGQLKDAGLHATTSQLIRTSCPRSLQTRFAMSHEGEQLKDEGSNAPPPIKERAKRQRQAPSTNKRQAPTSANKRQAPTSAKHQRAKTPHKPQACQYSTSAFPMHV
ncbi:hypothetical protein T492DRAFT_1083747 [Pavlovales sp. CCMP2436]|nr:hypothetical protein T492DRAFT_1083747 [Pavlovales sp. CCMP2436]